ncbi:uncharacterized protein LOC103717072 [Phoenix dactylifera]|uniref:Uncharacterized protein LOC103717072 n=1 Tax=Phoenix dactylifera TaxID=42345 RepID=A0A8B7CPH1_PHODC|nr:uncharacterized protein LOC103717072 [Phoenix dactylifera]
MVIAAADASVEARRRLDEPKAARMESPSPSLSRSLPQSRLHNFSFPTLSWGSQRLLRCMKLPAGTNGEIAELPASGSREEPRAARKRSSPLSSSLERKGSRRTASRILEPKEREEGGEENAEESSAAAAAARPWNLRSRRAACVASLEIGRGRNDFSSSSFSPSLLQLEKSGMAKSAKPRSEVLERGERQKFSVSLTPEEVEQDFLALKGTKPPRRPKKRAKVVQKQLDSIFPGLWLSEITPDLYKVDAEELGG